jgi:DEAD/DEAH box helicase domain-containing protein
VFVYDGHPGGVGIARRGYERFDEWVARTERLIADCPCRTGCPSCVQSPKCGNLNEPLAKEGARRLLAALIATGGRRNAVVQ